MEIDKLDITSVYRELSDILVYQNFHDGILRNKYRAIGIGLPLT